MCRTPEAVSEASFRVSKNTEEVLKVTALQASEAVNSADWTAGPGNAGGIRRMRLPRGSPDQCRVLSPSRRRHLSCGQMIGGVEIG